MDWTLEDNMSNGLIFFATLTGRRRGHTPFAKTGAEASDTDAEAVEPFLAELFQGGIRG